jgi:hypothetical protein
MVVNPVLWLPDPNVKKKPRGPGLFSLFKRDYSTIILCVDDWLFILTV